MIFIHPLSLSPSLPPSSPSYCGHGTGCQYLPTDKFQLLDCRASALLMGCSSVKLAAGGSCCPSGTPLHYLTAGW